MTDFYGLIYKEPISDYVNELKKVTCVRIEDHDFIQWSQHDMPFFVRHYYVIPEISEVK